MFVLILGPDIRRACTGPLVLFFFLSFFVACGLTPRSISIFSSAYYIMYTN